MDMISAKDLKVKLDGNETLMLVDLQDAANFEHRHIPGAVNIPMDDKCAETCATVLKDKDATIVVYGEFDELGKGSQATDVLSVAGYTKLIRLTGGLMGWMEAGYAVEGGKAS
jgi:rhodanese-related sulfurtransferase